jgi:hypothetical protein
MKPMGDTNGVLMNSSIRGRVQIDRGLDLGRDSLTFVSIHMPAIMLL